MYIFILEWLLYYSLNYHCFTLTRLCDSLAFINFCRVTMATTAVSALGTTSAIIVHVIGVKNVQKVVKAPNLLFGGAKNNDVLLSNRC